MWFVNSTFNEFTADTASLSTQKNYDYWSFAVIGDTEDMRPITKRMIDDMATQSIDFVVHVGDVSSAADEVNMTTVRDAFSALPFPTYYIPGNNDLFFDEHTQLRSAATYSAVIQQPLNQHITHRNAQLLLLDNSYRKYGFTDETLAWFDEALTSNTSPFTFLFFHRPIYLPLEDLFGDDETPYSREQNKKMRERFSRTSVDYIFNGHIHTYLPYTLDGIPVVVTGGGGALPQTLLGGASAAYFHYLIVHVPHDAAGTPWVEVKRFE